MTERIIVSIFGPSGSGKSTIAKQLFLRLGDELAVRVPGDTFLIPVPHAGAAFTDQPLNYDWELCAGRALLPNGVSFSCPDFDFNSFTRRSVSGGRQLIARPIRIIDTMLPCPFADVHIYHTAPDSIRARRIRDRDTRWGTRVIDRWDHLEDAARRAATEFNSGQQPPVVTIATDGRSPAAVAQQIIHLL